MSSDNDNGETKGYLVGYGKPPPEHRFKKGVSGNPRGRPRKSKNLHKLDPLAQPTRSMILEEAYRPVVLREGDRIIELPAIQAVLRAMGVSAMRGNRFAQKTLTDIVRAVEDEHLDLQMRYLDGALDYKLKWEAELKRCEDQGLPMPEPLPHPDDVLIDFRTGAVRMAGPVTKEEKAAWDKLIARRDDSQAEVIECARLETEDPEHAKFYRDDRLFEQKIFDMLNEKLPERYQTKLEGRIRISESGERDDTGEDDSEAEAA
jgi:hypothetical protein